MSDIDFDDFADDDRFIQPEPDFFTDADFGDTDIDPIFLGNADLTANGEIFAGVYTQPGSDASKEDIDFRPLEELLGIRDDLDRFLDTEVSPVPEDFDFSADSVRGPYTYDQLKQFYVESGLFDIADAYQDDDGDYWVQIEGSP